MLHYDIPRSLFSNRRCCSFLSLFDCNVSDFFSFICADDNVLPIWSPLFVECACFSCKYDCVCCPSFWASIPFLNSEFTQTSWSICPIPCPSRLADCLPNFNTRHRGIKHWCATQTESTWFWASLLVIFFSHLKKETDGDLVLWFFAFCLFEATVAVRLSISYCLSFIPQTTELQKDLTAILCCVDYFTLIECGCFPNFEWASRFSHIVMQQLSKLRIHYLPPLPE